MRDISPRLGTYLIKYFQSRVASKRAAGIKVTLTWFEFLNMMSDRQLRTLEKAILHNRLVYLQADSNPYALMLTWAGYHHHSVDEPVFSRDTARFCCRMTSARINRPQKGDKLGRRHRASISVAKTGVMQSADHSANISKAKKGVAIRGWSEERRAEASRRRCAAEHAKRQKTNNMGGAR